MKYFLASLCLVVVAVVTTDGSSLAKCVECGANVCEAEFDEANSGTFVERSCLTADSCFKFGWNDGTTIKVIRGCLPASEVLDYPAKGSCIESTFEYNNVNGTFCVCDGVEDEYCNGVGGNAPLAILIMAALTKIWIF